MDGVDRWGVAAFDGTKQVAAITTAPHSWIALSRLMASGRRLYFLLSHGGTDTNRAGMYASFAPFVGSSVSADPTATSQWAINENNVAISSPTVAAHYLNSCLSADGDFYFWGIRAGSGGLAEYGFAIASPIDFNPVDACPAFTYWKFTAGGHAWLNQSLCSVGTAGLATRSGVGGANYFNMLLFPPTFTGGGGVDQIENALPDFLVSLAAAATSPGSAAMRGRLPDFGLTWALASGPPAATGTVRRNISTNAVEYILIGSVVFPFNDTITVI
jgi:hypothetical protein